MKNELLRRCVRTDGFFALDAMIFGFGVIYTMIGIATLEYPPTWIAFTPFIGWIQIIAGIGLILLPLVSMKSGSVHAAVAGLAVGVTFSRAFFVMLEYGLAPLPAVLTNSAVEAIAISFTIAWMQQLVLAFALVVALRTYWDERHSRES